MAAAAVGANVGSVATIQRTPADAVYSLVDRTRLFGRRLDQGKTYCRPVEPEPEPPAFCTRSLGSGELLEGSGDGAGRIRVGSRMGRLN